MSSTFYIVHHEFKVGKSENGGRQLMPQWLLGAVDDAVVANKEKDFLIILLMWLIKQDPFIVFGKQREFSEEFQEFIDGPSGPGFGQDALMNICKPIDTSLMNGQTPYPRVFH